jgi:hypothetical protein
VGVLDTDMRRPPRANKESPCGWALIDIVFQSHCHLREDTATLMEETSTSVKFAQPNHDFNEDLCYHSFR